jgi:hypothetical protein
VRLEQNNINKVSIKTEQIRAGYSHIKEVSFRVYLDSSLVTWVTVEDFTCVVTAFFSLHCLLRIQPGTALFFCVAVDFLETRAFGQRALGWGAFVQCEG